MEVESSSSSSEDDEPEEGCVLFVKNLNFDTTEESIEKVGTSSVMHINPLLLSSLRHCKTYSATS